MPCNHNKHSFPKNPSCHHPKRIFCEITESWNCNLWSRHHWRMLLHPCTVSSLQHWISCSCHVCMHWVSIQLPAQRILIQTRTKFKPQPHACLCGLPPTTCGYPQHVGTRNPLGAGVWQVVTAINEKTLKSFLLCFCPASTSCLRWC